MKNSMQIFTGSDDLEGRLRIMYKRTYSFLETSNQIYKSQYGFRTSHSCENAICELVSEIIKGKQDGCTLWQYFWICPRHLIV